MTFLGITYKHFIGCKMNYVRVKWSMMESHEDDEEYALNVPISTSLVLGLMPVSCTMSRTSFHSSSGSLLSDIGP